MLSRDGIYSVYQLGSAFTFDFNIGIVVGSNRHIKYILLEADRRIRDIICVNGLPTGCFNKLTRRLP